MAKRKPLSTDNRSSLDKNAFRIDDSTSETWRAVTDESVAAGLTKLGPLSGIDWDAHSKTVLVNVETYQFFSGGLAGTLLATAVLTYVSSDLDDLVSSEWSYP
jgi:hypothetical protein